MKRAIANSFRIVGIVVAVYAMCRAYVLWIPLPGLFHVPLLQGAWRLLRPYLLLMAASTCCHIANAIEGREPSSSFCWPRRANARRSR